MKGDIKIKKRQNEFDIFFIFQSSFEKCKMPNVSLLIKIKSIVYVRKSMLQLKLFSKIKLSALKLYPLVFQFGYEIWVSFDFIKVVKTINHQNTDR